MAQEWLEDEDDEWHEDTLEWRERKWRLKEEEQHSKAGEKPAVETKVRPLHGKYGRSGGRKASQPDAGHGPRSCPSCASNASTAGPTATHWR